MWCQTSMSAVSRQCVPYGTFMTNSADSRATISGESGNNQLVERRRISSSLTQNQMNSFAKYTQQKPIDFFANRSCDDRVEYIFRDFESDSDHQEAEEQLEYRDQETFCYLCSIHAHVHKPTQPVPLSKVLKLLENFDSTADLLFYFRDDFYAHTRILFS